MKIDIFVKRLIPVIASVYLVACGGGSEAISKVSYSDKVASGTVEDYTNADWLFQNYFGDYGLPDQVKPQFMPALKMLANGFVLQLKTGSDVKKNIEQVHSVFLQYAATGQATSFFTSVQNDVASANTQPITTSVKNDIVTVNEIL